jgi:hypothetical protein
MHKGLEDTLGSSEVYLLFTNSKTAPIKRSCLIVNNAYIEVLKT